MSVFSATSFWNIQPVVVTPAGPSYAVRTDPYSASLVLAMPYYNFTTLGMSAFTQSLDGLIRTGNQANSYQLKSTGSAGFLYPSGSTVSFSGSLWSADGYASSMAIQNAQNAGTYNSTIGTSNFVLEFFINVQTTFTNPPFHGHIFGTNGGGPGEITMQYSSTPQFRVYINGDNSWTTTPNYNLGTNNQNWKHVAIVKSSTNLYVYVNGTRIGVGTRASNWPNSIGTLFGTNSNNDGLFRLIQDVRMYVGTDKGYTGATITVPPSIVDET